MKMFKKGFSVAELLLCVCIIGIISAMGITITKHTAEKAYNRYFFTGYNNLYLALCDFESKNWQYEKYYDASGDVEKFDISDAKSLVKALGTIFDDSTVNESAATVTAKNGIQYKVSYSYDTGTDGQIEDYYRIVMYVPSQKSKANTDGKATSCLLYIRKPSSNFFNLFPVPCSESSDTIKGFEVQLQNRRDLLPFYLNDGFPAKYGIAHYDFVTVFCNSTARAITENLKKYNSTCNYDCSNVDDIRVKRVMGGAQIEKSNLKGVITLGNPHR